MKARKIKFRNQFVYAELLKSYDKKAIGLILKFKSTQNAHVQGIVMKSDLEYHPVGSSIGMWSNPLTNEVSWKMLPDYKE